MRVCVKFSREGFCKYLAHLDIQRLFVRAIKRAGIPAKYSSGFNPHMNISFAYPLGVGIETLGDYFEFVTTRDIDVVQAQKQLQEQMPEGFSVVAVGQLCDTEGKLMALTQQAEYRLEKLPMQFMDWMKSFLQEKSYNIRRERKGKIQTIDIRPSVRECIFLTQQSLCLWVDCSSGSALNPTLLLKQAAEVCKQEITAQVIRLELYTQKNGSMLPLQTLFG